MSSSNAPFLVPLETIKSRELVDVKYRIHFAGRFLGDTSSLRQPCSLLFWSFFFSPIFSALFFSREIAQWPRRKGSRERNTHIEKREKRREGKKKKPRGGKKDRSDGDTNRRDGRGVRKERENRSLVARVRQQHNQVGLEQLGDPRAYGTLGVLARIYRGILGLALPGKRQINNSGMALAK